MKSSLVLSYSTLKSIALAIAVQRAASFFSSSANSAEVFSACPAHSASAHAVVIRQANRFPLSTVDMKRGRSSDKSRRLYQLKDAHAIFKLFYGIHHAFKAREHSALIEQMHIMRRNNSHQPHADIRGRSQHCRAAIRLFLKIIGREP